jgi:carbon monoxide dehydrogenase subunit G
MRLQHEFRVDAPPEAVYPLLLDIERVAPCLPGAAGAERIDERTYRVAVNVALGPMKLSYRGEVAIVEADDASRRAVMEAKATEARGQGTARATITTTLSAQDGGTHADVVTDLQLTGRVAQMGRGIVEDVSRRLMGEFAECLSRRIDAGADEPPVEPRPIRGFALLWAALKARLFRRRR